MQEMIALQRWLYESMANGLSYAAQGGLWGLLLAMSTAFLFGILHAMMPGHGKTALFSYHLGQKTSLTASILNGTILALTHVGIAIILVASGFAVISKLFATGGRTPQFETASGIMIVLIGAILLWQAMSRHMLSTRKAAGNPEDGGTGDDQDPSTTRNGRTLAFVAGLVPCPLTTFIMSYALARGLLAAGLAVTAAMATGMVLTIATVAVVATLSRERLLAFFSRSKALRSILGGVLETGGALLLLGFGLYVIVGAHGM